MKAIFFTTIIIAMAIFSVKSIANEEAQPIKIVSLAKNLYQHISYKQTEGFGMVPSSGLIVVHDQEAFIIDTPWTNHDTADLMLWLEKKQLSLAGSISTHWHADRSGGIAHLNKQGIKTYATPLTNQFLNAKQSAMATQALSSEKDVLFHQKIETYFFGAGHSLDNIVVWLPEHKLLFGGCLIRSLKTQGLGNTSDANIATWPATIDRIIAHFPTVVTVVPGHGKIGDRKLLHHTQALTKSANIID